MRAESGLKATLATRSVWPERVAICRPSASHRRAVPSVEAVKKRLPSELNAMLFTLAGWRRLTSSLPSASHSCAVFSSAAARMRVPSGLNTALHTRPACAEAVRTR